MINLPSGYSAPSVVAVPKGTEAVAGALECIVLTPTGTNFVKLDAKAAAPAASCDSRLDTDVIATIASPSTPTTPSLSTCSGQKSFLAAGYNWRTKDCGNFARTWRGAASQRPTRASPPPKPGDPAEVPTNCNGCG